MNDLRQVESTARPLRVAYLIEVGQCPHELLDAIFAESYSRWGGRRTLIVPTTPDKGIHEDYEKWLYAHDPDIIYSYVDLNDEIVESIHETYCPLYLTKHDRRGGTNTTRNYVPELPLKGLSCVSVFPFLLDRRGLENFSGCKILDCSPSLEPPRFLSDNFGTCYKSFHSTAIAQKYPELYKTLTLISEETLNNPRIGKSKATEYETDFHALISKLATRGERILTLSMLSDYLSWYLDFYSPDQSESFNLVVGDTVQDRILFWNFRYYYTNLSTSEIVDLVASSDDMVDADRLGEIENIVRNRSYRSNSCLPITIRSFSQSEEQLDSYAEYFREKLPNAHVRIQKMSSDKEYIPEAEGRRNHFVHFKTGTIWNESKSTAKLNYSAEHVDVPVALPTHMKDLQVPPGLRSGIWMLDLYIQRQHTHSRIANIEHIWALPRRIRVDRLFKRSDDFNRQDHNCRNIRVNRNTMASIPVRYGMEQPSFELPGDVNAILGGVTSRFDWEPFDVSIEHPICGRTRFVAAKMSDKGRYFQGVMQYFGSIAESEQILMNKFWHQIFSDLGASESYISEQSISQVSRRIERRTQKENPSNFLQDAERRKDFAKKCLSIAVNVAREKQYVSWAEMLQFWEKAWEKFIRKNPQLEDQAEEIKADDKRTVEESAQLLCQKKIIFQGQQWKCHVCNHKNWESIENLKTTLVCEVCGNEEPAPIAQDWKFKLNEFVLDAMRQHGTTALIWCLIQLSNRARSSFYYTPSMKLLDSPPEADEEKWVETDLMAVIDGDFYVCEVKSSSSVSDRDIDSFINIVNRLRPDVALFAIMEEGTGIPESIVNRIDNRIDDDIKLEVLTLHESHFEDDARLPNGSTFVMQVF